MQQDQAFKEFLKKLQDQNNRDFVVQLGQLKTEREIKEDDEKNDELLEEIDARLEDVRKAVTGVDIDIDLTPLVNIGENQTRLLDEISKESALMRKLSEGSIEYDKEASQYRNKSGREIESVVSGKMSKKGGFIDFETARNATSGQGERARTANEVKLKTIDYVPGKITAGTVTKVTNNNSTTNNTDNSTTEKKSFFKYLGDEIVSGVKYFMTDGLSEGKTKKTFQKSKDVEKKERTAKVSSARQKPDSANPKAETIAIAQQEVASNTKSDLEISKQLLDTTKAQLTELQAIKEALAPSTPKELVEQKSAPSATEKEDVGGGSILGDLAGAAGDLLSGRRGKAGKAGKAGKGVGGKMLGGIGKAARVLGPVAAIAGAAYSGVEGLQNTNANFDLEEGQQATIGQKTASALGGVASGLTFGLIDEKSAAQGIHKAGEVIGDTASKAGSFISEKASSAGSAISSFFGFGDKTKQVQGVSAEQAALARSNYAAVDPRRVDTTGRTVANTSTENVDMNREASKGGSGGNTIVSNSVNSTNTTKYVPMKASPRPEYSGSALDRYQSRITVY